MVVPKSLRNRVLCEIISTVTDIQLRMRFKKDTKSCARIAEMAEFLLKNEYNNAYMDREMDKAEQERNRSR